MTFTPTDTADYNTVTAQQNVDVDPATPVITWPNPADIIDGAPLTSTQLDATANVPGTFTYSPAAGTVLAAGQHQALGVVFTPTDGTDYNVVGATAYVNVDYGPAAKLAFMQQPSPTSSGTPINPAVTVAVEDSAGSTLPGDTSTVTLTLSGGTFTGGGNTVSAPGRQRRGDLQHPGDHHQRHVHPDRLRRLPRHRRLQYVHHRGDRLRQLQHARRPVSRRQFATNNSGHARRHELELEFDRPACNDQSRWRRRRRHRRRRRR